MKQTTKRKKAGQIIVNTPPSNRAIQRFKNAFPNATFLSRATLGSKKNSYIISLKEYENREEELKKLKMTKAKDQFLLK